MARIDYLLSMEGITKRFPGVLALDEVNFNVRRGSVHALLGENGAGKSTLMKCLFGIYKMESGTIVLDGQKVSFSNSKEALSHGVSMVHQELDQVPERNVVDNLWLGRYPRYGPFLNKKKMISDTKELFKKIDINFSLTKKLKDFSVSDRQIIDIIKAVSYDSKIIVLDEPTSSLTDKEVEFLFRIIRQLKDQGRSIIYISHKLEEIKKIADEITIMRDGCSILTEAASALSIQQIIQAMVGRSMTQQFPPRKGIVSRDVVLEAKHLCGIGENTINDVSFKLCKGEILGVAGLLGARRTELLETIYGLRHIKSGILTYKGVSIKNENTMQAIHRGFALLTEERRYNGIFPEGSLRFNSVIASIAAYQNKFKLLSGKKIAQSTDWVIRTLNVRNAGPLSKIRSLSGGNQQKILLGRWLLRDAEVLLLDEPTRGIDVGAKYEIYQLMINLAKEGKAIMFVSSEMPELLGVSDRIMVLSSGYTSEIFNINDAPEMATQQNIMVAAAKYL